MPENSAAPHPSQRRSVCRSQGAAVMSLTFFDNNQPTTAPESKAAKVACRIALMTQR
jgi:hypothetical protein